VALVLVDIDDFKAVNDAHSHLVGDAVIRGIAEVLRANTRPVDVAMRLGGDEFALFLPALHAQAVEVAERIRGQVAERDWTAVAPGLRVTVSTGVADHVPGQDGIALFAAADEKLYDAKRGGRNRVAH
jgi:diguanylate cyclase (GGDEF)-like protein